MSGNATGDSVNGTDGSQLGITPIGMAFLQDLSLSPTGLSEDCLTLNIWTKPQTGESKKAVLMFIYGGAFVSGMVIPPSNLSDALLMGPVQAVPQSLGTMENSLPIRRM